MDQGKLSLLYFCRTRESLNTVSEEKAGENIYRILESGFVEFKVILLNWGTI